MKQTLLILAVAVCFVADAQAQLLIPFKAKEGVSVALTSAGQNFDNPRLVAVATADGTLPVGAIEIDNMLNLNNGNAQLWVYVIQDGESSENPAFFVGSKTFLGVTVLNVPLESLPEGAADILGFITSPLEENYYDSDQMVSALHSDSDFQAFMQSNPEAGTQIAALNQDDILADAPVWTIRMTSETDAIFCRVNAANGETICADSPISDVEFAADDKNGIIVYPNPASDITAIHINKSIVQPGGRLAIFDALGNKVAERSYIGFQDEHSVFSVKNLPNGSYFVRYYGKEHSFTVPVIVQH